MLLGARTDFRRSSLGSHALPAGEGPAQRTTYDCQSKILDDALFVSDSNPTVSFSAPNDGERRISRRSADLLEHHLADAGQPSSIGQPADASAANLVIDGGMAASIREPSGAIAKRA